MKYYCPTNELDCPYFKFGDGSCKIENPLEDCDEYMFYHSDELDNKEPDMIIIQMEK